MQAFSFNSHSLIHFGKAHTIVFEIQSNEFCNYTMKYVNTFNGMERMNFMGGKASHSRSGRSCSICRENHCQLAQNKSNTSLVPDSNGFGTCACACVHVCFLCVAATAAAAHYVCRVKSRRPSLSHVHSFRNDADIHVQFLWIWVWVCARVLELVPLSCADEEK